ncbi:PHD finger protein 20 isoform X2 [Tribolium madens]|uniref:PHD finger protein 20 isoform X2 n=1 Tax=Tribolium madens TaxID=41895 RepID=UPI001CF738ED|nr:PHD finger protein 20 isoform X2 [Tribolium madens]
MGRKCGVEDCLSDSNRPEDIGVTFHKVPSHSDTRQKWISLCRIPEDKKSMKGVLPSVFPWDKSKLEAIKTTKSEPEKTQDKPDEKEADSEKTETEEVSMKEEPEEPNEDKVEDGPPTDSAKSKEKSGEAKEKIRMNANGPINFAINSRIEALDNNNTWYPARIVEEDYEGNEVLIHFEKFSSKYDEWICMDSPRLRPLQSHSGKKTLQQFTVGERCLAAWTGNRKFPATITKVLPNDTYEVLFDDGFVKNLKAHLICKTEGRPTQSSPLFDPIQSSKQERREKKRKINIAALFGKRPRLDITDEKPKTPSHSHISQPQNTTDPSEEVFDPWVPQWEDGKPVGTEAQIETTDGTRKSIIVPDPRLPEGWTKHLAQRMHGASAGKWDTIIVSPDNRRFRSKSEIKSYLEDTKLMKYNWSMFDFTIHRPRNRRKEPELASNFHPEIPVEQPLVEHDESSELAPEEEENKSLLKIPIVDDGYQCPIDGCGKTFRKENLAQMHVKHYHPEYMKFLDSTPNVADLAYARTVGESLDKSPGSKTPAAKPLQKSAIPRSATKTHSPQLDSDKPHSPQSHKIKDSEIIKLLNTKTADGRKESDPVKALPAGLPSSMYPDFKLKDLLSKSEGIPSHNDLSLRALSTTRPPAGIKTLLPVRPENKTSQPSPESENVTNRLKSTLRRKRGLVDSVDSPKGNEPPENTYIPLETPPLSEPNNIIIEGGKVIKIVRMKQEEIINCTCGFTEEDGLMIQCDLCLCWQHASCNNIERESQVPEKYVCYICQNPIRQRLSKKYFHDQDWLKHGVLATTSFHTKDEEMLSKRFEKLKKSHDISGGLLEVREFVNTLKVKLKIAEAKNHPKLYLWSKPWEKLPLPEKCEDEKPKEIKSEDEIKTESPIKAEPNSDSMLMMILKNTKEESAGEDNLDKLPPPIIPQPEAAIDSSVCRVNLLEHIAHAQSLVEERLDDFEKQIDQLEDTSIYENDEDYPRTRQTLHMLLRDLNTLQELSQLTTL